jgi:hypothetical protein
MRENGRQLPPIGTFGPPTHGRDRTDMACPGAIQGDSGTIRAISPPMCLRVKVAARGRGVYIEIGDDELAHRLRGA